MKQVAPYRTRPMKPGDISAVIAIDQQSFPSPWPALAFSYELRQPHSHYYVLLKPTVNEPTAREPRWRRWLDRILDPLKESPVIGYVGFRSQGRPPSAHISTLAVHPDWRGKGLGELLLLMALEQSLKLEVGTVSLEVRASNQVAQRLYRKYGFQLKCVRRGYYRDGENAWLMEVEMHRSAYRARLTHLRQVLKGRIHQSVEIR